MAVCCLAVAGRGAKLGPLFTVCLFLSYWDSTDKSRAGTAGNQEAVDARDLSQELRGGLGVRRPACPTQTEYSQTSRDGRALFVPCRGQ